MVQDFVHPQYERAVIRKVLGRDPKRPRDPNPACRVLAPAAAHRGTAPRIFTSRVHGGLAKPLGLVGSAQFLGKLPTILCETRNDSLDILFLFAQSTQENDPDWWQMTLILGVPSNSILSRDPNLLRKPSKTRGKQIRFLRKERWLKRMEMESTPRAVGARSRRKTPKLTRELSVAFCSH